jgi:type III restriction enzyme
MSRIELLDFQQTAADKLFHTAINYFVSGQDKIGGRLIPFVGQLKAVTGAGKTPILANVIGRIHPAIVLWTTKFGSVVDQTVANLRVGGKYHHILGANAEVIKFTDLTSASEWHRILEQKVGLTILVSTVAAWFSNLKDDRLNVHRVSADWGDKSRWDQLRYERERPLWVVYDEAHNTTTEQIEQLDELEPAGFFVASASPVKGKLQMYLTQMDEEVRNTRIVPVSTRAVVEAQLLKSTINLADYHSSTTVMLKDVVTRRQSLEDQLKSIGEPTTPKAIFVVEASNTTSGEPRPVTIWKTLVNDCKVPPSAIAVCTNTKDLPDGAVRVERIDQLSEDLTHIIFNKKLQEGWDDPSVYVCYFDGKTESATRIQQVLGRALRQPHARHLPDEDLNTAYFFINCPSEKLEEITDELKEELRIYKGPGEPEDFEPFKIQHERQVPAKIPVKPKWEGKFKVPRLQPELPAFAPLQSLINKKTFEFSEEDRAASGKAIVSIVSVKTGDVLLNQRDLLEDMRVRCGSFLQDQIRTLSKNCANALPTNIFSNKKLDLAACYKSKALHHYQEVAIDVVREYERQVKLDQLADPSDPDYVVGPYQPSTTVKKQFENAAHAYYDSKSFNELELEFAKALDKFGRFVWVRNKDRVGYGIPLPMKCGSSSVFYPDFLWKVKDTIWALDPTGRHILEEKIRAKLLTLPAPLRVALVTPGKYDSGYRLEADTGFTLVRHRTGNSSPQTFDSLDHILKTLVAES